MISSSSVAQSELMIKGKAFSHLCANKECGTDLLGDSEKQGEDRFKLPSINSSPVSMEEFGDRDREGKTGRKADGKGIEKDPGRDGE